MNKLRTDGTNWIELRIIYSLGIASLFCRLQLGLMSVSECDKFGPCAQVFLGTYMGRKGDEP
jgi:hypothetical protein